MTMLSEGRGSAPVRSLVLALAGALALAPAASRLLAQTAGSTAAPNVRAPIAAPAWTRGATCYEVFVRSFYDGDGDGIGDLKGLIRKLDYINDGATNATTAAAPAMKAGAVAMPAQKAAPTAFPRSLGARCIWLMPVMPSPSYHGYDITDYYGINPQYGTIGDFKRLVAEAHHRGIRVLIDMVLNHTSDRHPYFQAALKDPSSPYRDWYRFSPTDPGKDETGQDHWHRSPLRDEYYYGMFWKGMPDLNYEKAPAREEAKKIARFWLEDMGVDGFRLDAVTYLVEEGQRIQDTPGTHAFLREYADYVRRITPGAFTVGEATWGSQKLLMTYYPDQLDSYFPFELSDSLIAAVRNGATRGLLPLYLRLQAALPNNRYSPFQRNHDQTRTLTALGGDVARAKVAATLLLTLPGLPFVYYGEEIGMRGDKPDPEIRTPMQWSAAHGGGFTTGKPWEPLQPDWRTTNVAAEEADPGSLLNLYRRLIHLRAANPALGSGRLVPLTTPSDAVIAYLRRDGSRTVLVVANLGAKPLSGIVLSSAGGALPGGHALPAGGTLPPGDYVARAMLGGPAAARLHVGPDGRIRGYVPFATLAPEQAYVLELSPAE